MTKEKIFNGIQQVCATICKCMFVGAGICFAHWVLNLDRD